MHGDRVVTDKVMARPWTARLALHDGTMSPFSRNPRLARLLPGCRDAFPVPRYAISQDSRRLLNDLQYAGSVSHTIGKGLQGVVWFCEKARGGICNSPCNPPCPTARMCDLASGSGSSHSGCGACIPDCTPQISPSDIFDASSCPCPSSQFLIPLPCLIPRHLHKVGVIVFGLPGRFFHSIAKSASLGT